jgi:uncharacterized protein (UPF0276 family)
VLAHGVSAPIGGSRAPDPRVSRLFRETVALLEAQLASEHLSFNTAVGDDGEFSSAFFLPPRQTAAGADAAVASIDALRADLAVPFSVETPVSYLRPRADEMRDGAFVAAVADRADCGILLDLHNIWANERNGRQRVLDFVDDLSLDRVYEVHLAGGFDRNGYWLDAHSGGIHPALLELASAVLPRLPALRAVVYEILPEFVTQDGHNVLRRDLEEVHRLVERVRSRRRATRAEPASPEPTSAAATRAPRRGVASPDPRAWEDTLAALAIGRQPAAGTDLDAELAADPGIELLRELVGAGRAGRIGSSLPLTTELLISQRGIEEVEAELAAYAAERSPGLWGSEEGRRFAEWALQRFADDPLVRTAVRLDVAALDAVRDQRPHTIELDVEPLAFIASVHAGAVPDDQVTGRYLVTVGA